MKKFVSIFTIVCLLFCMNCFSPLFASAVDYTINFDEEVEGDSFENTALSEEFLLEAGTPDSGATIEEDEAGGNLMTLKGYTDIKSITYFEKAYTFSVDFISNADNTAVFVRGVEPSEYIQVENPKNQNVLQTFNYYEWDWYQENGGSTGSSIGGSGIYIMPAANIIKIGLKLYQEDGLGVSTKVFDLPAPEGYQRGKKCTIKVEDTTTSVTISVNGTKLAVVELSEPDTKYSTDDPSYGFYKKAAVKNAAGEELGAVENTRICSEYSQIAITTRNATFSIDNLSLQYEGSASEPTPSDPSATPEDDATGSPATASPKATATATAKATKTPVKATNAPSSQDSGNTPIIIAVVSACVVVAAGIIIAIIVAKKKKKS